MASDIVSTTPPTPRATDRDTGLASEGTGHAPDPNRLPAFMVDGNFLEDSGADAGSENGGSDPDAGAVNPPLNTGSLSRRMMLIAVAWISFLLIVGGVALDRTLESLLTGQFDEQLEFQLKSMIASAELGPDGEVRFNRMLSDQRFLEYNSGLYWQVSGGDYPANPSRSLWDRTIVIRDGLIAEEAIYYDSGQFADESLRIVQRTISLPGSEVQWQFVVGGSREGLDEQLASVRSILIWSFVILAIGLMLMAMLQTWYGLGPLRRVRRAIARIRTTGHNRVTDPLPQEVQPMVEELNALLAHSENQAEEARTHAGNLAHALKTPLTVLTNAATADAPDLDSTVMREAALMRRQVDHHLARARAVGRRAIGLSRADLRRTSVAVMRAVGRLYPECRLDLDGQDDIFVAIERQDLEEILGNLIENAAKYGGGSVFVTLDPDEPAPDSGPYAGVPPEKDPDYCWVWVEDDGTGIPEKERSAIFARGARLDTDKPGTGLGLAIVRDVVAIYGGDVELDRGLGGQPKGCA